MMRIVFFGDSIFSGQFTSPHLNWVTRLSATITSQIPFEVTTSNPSIPGDTTRIALERMPHDVQAFSVDILITQFGMNDCNFWKTDRGLPRVSQAAFAANLTEIVTRGKAFGAKQVVLCTNHPTFLTERLSYAPMSYQEHNEIYNTIIRQVATETGAILLDNERIWQNEFRNGSTPRSFLLDDGVHLNLKGHELYYNSSLPLIESTILTVGE